MRFFRIILDWSEVWALLIPLLVILFKRPREKSSGILGMYVVIGFVLNCIAIFMVEFYNLIPRFLYVDNMVNNNILYNIHSIVRAIFLSWYIIATRPYRNPVFIKILLAAYLVFVLFNFIFIESPLFLSTRLFAAESIVLLTICFSYFLRALQDESHHNWIKHPSFLVGAGISLYEVITFFIFLFFYPLSQKDQAFFVFTMRVYNLAFILLCILISIALLKTIKNSDLKS